MERIRFIIDPGYPNFELSYFHVIYNNKKYNVLNSPFDEVTRKKFKSNLYNILNDEKVYIKNFFNSISNYISNVLVLF